MESPMIPQGKNYWEKPEGTTGMVVGVAGVIGVGYVLHQMLPTIVNILENTLYATFLGITLAGIGYVLMDKGFQNLIWYGYRGLTRTITKAFIDIDPISILETYIQHLNENLNRMSQQISNLNGQKSELKKIIDENKVKLDNSLKLAEKAKEVGKKTDMILKTRKAGRLQNSNLTLETLYKKMELLYTVLNKMHENAGALIEDMTDEVMVKKQEYQAVSAGHSALKSAMSILKGDLDKKMMFDMANEALADQVGMKIGEMEHFMKMSENIMNGIDLQNMVFEDEGFKMLEEWEKKSNSLLLGSDKVQIVAESNVLELVPVKTKIGKTKNRWEDV
jgi:hypothetical protein